MLKSQKIKENLFPRDVLLIIEDRVHLRGKEFLRQEGIRVVTGQDLGDMVEIEERERVEVEVGVKVRIKQEETRVKVDREKEEELIIKSQRKKRQRIRSPHRSRRNLSRSRPQGRRVRVQAQVDLVVRVRVRADRISKEGDRVFKDLVVEKKHEGLKTNQLQLIHIEFFCFVRIPNLS